MPFSPQQSELHILFCKEQEEIANFSRRDEEHRFIETTRFNLRKIILRVLTIAFRIIIRSVIIAIII